MDYQAFAKQLFATLLLQALTELLRPKTKRTPLKANSLKDLNFPTNSNTRPIPYIFGTERLDAANTLWAGDLKTAERTKKIKTGLFSYDTISIGLSYFCGFAMGLGHYAPGAKLTRIWVNKTLAWTGSLFSGQTAAISYEYGDKDNPNGLSGTIEFHNGDMAASPYLNGAVALNGDAQCFSHLAYIVFRGPNGGSVSHNFGDTNPNGWVGSEGTLPQIEFELSNTQLMPIEWVPTADRAAFTTNSNISSDANLAYAAYFVMRDPVVGAGIPAEMLEWPMFHAAAGVLRSEGNGFSLEWDSARECSLVTDLFASQANGLVHPAQSSFNLGITLLRSTDPVRLALTPSNITVLDSYKKTKQTTNEVTITYKDRTQDYKEITVAASDKTDIEQSGRVYSVSSDFPGLRSPTAVALISEREVSAAVTPLAQISGTVVTSIRDLFPGDTVTFTWPDYGITNLRMRLTTVTYSDAVEGTVDFDAVQDVFASGTATYAMSVPPVSGPVATPRPTATIGKRYMLKAPKSLTTSDRDAPIVLVAPGAANQSMFNLAFDTTDYRGTIYENTSGGSPTFNSATVAWHPAGPFPLSGYGTCPAGYTTSSTSVTIVCTSYVGAYLRTVNIPSSGLIVALGCEDGGGYPGRGDANTTGGRQEFARCSAISVASDNLSATLTLSKRGIWDTTPSALYANSTYGVWVLGPGSELAIDSSGGMAAALYGNTGLFGVIPGELFTSAWAYIAGPGGNAPSVSWVGVMDASDGTTTSPNVGYLAYASRALHPYSPGQITFGGAIGAFASAASYPSFNPLVANNLAIKHRSRNALGDEAFASPSGQLEPGCVLYWSIEKRLPGSTAWNAVTVDGASGTMSVANSTALVPALETTAPAAGTAYRVVAYVVRFIDGTSSYVGQWDTSGSGYAYYMV